MTDPTPAEIVEAFAEQCGWAWTVRNQFRTLYEKGEEQQTLLEKVARDYFAFMAEVMIEYSYLAFSRLTDPAHQSGHSNLSAPYVAEELEWPADVQGQLDELLAKLLAFRKCVVLPRSKLIAHADLAACLAGKPLGAFPEGEDEQFFEDLQEFVNTAHQHLAGEPRPINSVSPRDALNLLRSMKGGESFEVLWREHPEIASRIAFRDQEESAGESSA